MRDARAVLGVLDGQALDGAARDAAELLAMVAGQDVEQGVDGRFRIVQGVARDRIISTVDPEARHGHKSLSRHFDGYKGHISVDPDSEIIDNVTVTPANVADQDAADELLRPVEGLDAKPVVMGDSAYAGGEFREHLDEQGFEVTAKVPPASNRGGLFTKDEFGIDLDKRTVRCPADHVVPIVRRSEGTGMASFGEHCVSCPLRDQCTSSKLGRKIRINRYEARIQKAKHEQSAPEWKAEYRATRPKVERKFGHLTRRAHGGRKARSRGLARVFTDFVTRAAAINLARLATLGLHHKNEQWAV